MPSYTLMTVGSTFLKRSFLFYDRTYPTMDEARKAAIDKMEKVRYNTFHMGYKDGIIVVSITQGDGWVKFIDAGIVKETHNRFGEFQSYRWIPKDGRAKGAIPTLNIDGTIRKVRRT